VKLRIELATAIHKKMYSNIKFFHNRDKSFIAWIGTFLRPINIQEKDYIYKEGEEITESKVHAISFPIVYFVVSGQASYVLPRFDNHKYFKIELGDHFGHIDLGQDVNYFKQ
jgi:hypothetical protein